MSDARSLHCPNCGAAADPEARRCPFCKARLAAISCPSCFALMFEGAAFCPTCGAPAASGAGRQQPVRYRSCARCGTMMNRVNFGRLSGAVVDVCKKHGTFLDAGELQQIVAFIQAGGLERARARQIEELREEQAKLKIAETRANAARGQASPHESIGFRTTSAWDGTAVVELINFFTSDS